MLAYATRRILVTIPLLVVASFVIFVLVSISGNPEDKFATCTLCDQTAFDRIREVFQLDLPIHERYLAWFGNAFQGDLGQAPSLGFQPVASVLWARFINTMYLAIPAFILIAILAVALGVYSAVKQYSPSDYAITGFSFLGISMPTFFFGLLLQIVLVVWWQKWTGTKPFFATGMHTESVGALLASATLPVITIMLVVVAGESRFERAAMLEVINSDYIRTAKAKGMPQRTVIMRHALRNALIPLVTIWALDFSALLGGSVITETIFAWPGLGRLLVAGIFQQDVNMVMAITMFIGLLVVVFNLLADLLYGVLDPRIRYD